jgi:undecaprenyl-diphosphatase
MAKFDRPARRTITLIVIGTVPAAILGLIFKDKVEEFISNPRAVAAMLIVTGIILLSTRLLRLGDRTMSSIRPLDSLLIGLAQASALIPGISRPGMTISAGLTRGLTRVEAARFAFLLGIPVIAGAGLLGLIEVVSSGDGVPATVWLGVVVAGLSGYAAISFLLRVLSKVGLAPFGVYCVAFGALSLVLL